MAVSRARRSTKSTVAELSMTGDGVRLADDGGDAAGGGCLACGGERSRGGWRRARRRRRACRSRPGATILPPQLMMSVPSGTPAAPMPRLASRITPSAISTSPAPSRSLEGSIEARIGEQDGAAIGQHGHHALGRLRASASSTAMRTATPISTCSRISDCAPSATMESISTPRFIGPGCITSASGLA